MFRTAYVHVQEDYIVHAALHYQSTQLRAFES